MSLLKQGKNLPSWVRMITIYIVIETQTLSLPKLVKSPTDNWSVLQVNIVVPYTKLRNNVMMIITKGWVPPVVGCQGWEETNISW